MCMFKSIESKIKGLEKTKELIDIKIEELTKRKARRDAKKAEKEAAKNTTAETTPVALEVTEQVNQVTVE